MISSLYTSQASVLAQLKLDAADAALASRITALITTMSRQIDVYCRRSFYETTETRYFDVPRMNGRNPGRLWLDKDLMSLTTLIDGDGNTITSEYYRVCPLNFPVKRWIELKYEKYPSRMWAYGNEHRGTVAVTGSWGYNTTEADAIVGEAAAAWIADIIRRGEETGIQNKTIGDYSVSYQAGSSEQRMQTADGHQIMMPPTNIALALNAYRFREVAGSS